MRKKTRTKSETMMTRTREASIRRTNAQSGIQFNLNYVRRCDKDIERVWAKIQPTMEHKHDVTSIWSKKTV